VKITKQQLRRIIREVLLREGQPGMDPDPSGQEVRDKVGEYQSFFDPTNNGWTDKAHDAAMAAGPTGLAKWLVDSPQSIHYHLFDGGIWKGMAEQFQFDPEDVSNEICRLKPDAWDPENDWSPCDVKGRYK
jgi:hypothetical protein